MIRAKVATTSKGRRGMLFTRVDRGRKGWPKTKRRLRNFGIGLAITYNAAENAYSTASAAIPNKSFPKVRRSIWTWLSSLRVTAQYIEPVKWFIRPYPGASATSPRVFGTSCFASVTRRASASRNIGSEKSQYV